MDNFKEQLVTVENKTAYKISTIFMYVFAVMAFLFFVIQNLIFGIIFALAAGFLFYFKRYLYTEFEYSITNGEIDIDKILEMKSRKRIISFNMKDVELLAPIDSDIYKGYSSKPSEKVPAIPSGNSDRAFSAVISQGGKKLQVIFAPNEEFVKLCFLYNPKAVKKNN
ncbi:hypothetical protein [Clostridium polynesiense]|uniref:hypothetical protein n=1 Tax=Clostridium polynesiense TaxID=1325933 RepID=UPI00058E4774|nr:hypothetical protein [Clostridium polynesiense]